MQATFLLTHTHLHHTHTQAFLQLQSRECLQGFLDVLFFCHLLVNMLWWPQTNTDTQTGRHTHQHLEGQKITECLYQTWAGTNLPVRHWNSSCYECLYSTPPPYTWTGTLDRRYSRCTLETFFEGGCSLKNLEDSRH